MTMNCLRHFARGFFGKKPVPYHREFLCWSSGLDASSLLIVLCIPVALVAVGYLIGRY